VSHIGDPPFAQALSKIGRGQLVLVHPCSCRGANFAARARPFPVSTPSGAPMWDCSLALIASYGGNH